MPFPSAGDLPEPGIEPGSPTLYTDALLSEPPGKSYELSKGMSLLFNMLSRFVFPGGLDGKASVYNAGHLGSIPGSGRSAGEGNGNPLQYYCLESPTDRGAW